MRQKTYNPKNSLLNQVLYGRAIYIYIGHGRRDGKNRLGARELECGNWSFGTHTLLSMGFFLSFTFLFFRFGIKTYRAFQVVFASQHTHVTRLYRTRVARIQWPPTVILWHHHELLYSSSQHFINRFRASL